MKRNYSYKILLCLCLLALCINTGIVYADDEGTVTEQANTAPALEFVEPH